MTYPLIDPILIHIGPFAVRWYGLMYVVGFLLGYLLLRNLSKREQYDLTKEEVGDLLYYCMVGLVVGARLGYCFIYNFSYYLTEPLKIFAVWEGGMSFHGGLAGTAVAGWLFSHRRRKSLLMIADMGAVAAPLGLFFGRIGNFINGELYGRETALPWGIVFPGAGNVPRHPSQLYEALFEGAILFVLLFWFSRRPRPHGFLMAVFLMGYGLFRFFLEFFRAPDPQLGFVVGPFTMGQVLCGIMVAAGILLKKYADWRWKGENGS
jgi:phosphatidylglycerol:prolipoprotein diacylglycerol transferase